MSETRMPKRPWILMHLGSEGWLPSMDYFCAWRTKKAAQRKIKSLGQTGKMYKAFRYVAPPDREKVK